MGDLLQKIGNGATTLATAAGLVVFSGVTTSGQEPVRQSAAISIDSRVQEENIARDFIQFVYNHREALDKVIRANDWGWKSWVKDSSFSLLFNGNKFTYLAEFGDPNFPGLHLHYENYETPLTDAQRNAGIWGSDVRYVANISDGRVRSYSYSLGSAGSKPQYSDVSHMSPDEIRKHQLDLDTRLKEFRAVIDQYILKTPQR